MNNKNITFSFLEKIEKANRDFGLFRNEKILVGLSGGADSVSLLLSLKMLSGKYGFSLCALHVNHMIRGKEADRDEEFSKSLCQNLCIEFFCERVDVRSICKESGQSLELCARNERYSAFERVCKEHGIKLVATAHNACDNAETMVFNLVRGSGVRGLCGIPPKRSLCEGVTVVRPLINVSRAEIEAFLAENGQTFVTDSTNTDTDYTRNYIRHEIMPHLAKLNSSIEESLARSAGLHRQDEEYLSVTARNNVTDSIAELSKLHDSILSRVVMELFSDVSDETLPEYHIKMLCTKIREYDGERIKLSLPDSMIAVLEKGKLSFEKDLRGKENETDFEIPLTDGWMFFEENPYALYISFDQNEDIPQTIVKEEIVYKKYTTDYLYFATIPHVLFVRSRRDGDKIFSSGMNKSIKRIMLDSDFDAKERYLVPFVCTDEEILLVPSCVKNDKCKKSGHADKTLGVTLYRKI